MHGLSFMRSDTANPEHPYFTKQVEIPQARDRDRRCRQQANRWFPTFHQPDY